jgi:hypothetical protein
VPSKFAGALVFLASLLAAALALAEHEVYYRYTVLGFVKDPRGNPRQGVEVELVRTKTGFSYLGETDATGFYAIVARLGDESSGEPLRLRAGKESTTLQARFDPQDHTRERGTRVDWLGPKAQELPTAFTGTLKRFLAR